MHDLVRDPRDVFRRHHAVLTAPHSRMITSSLCTRNRSASVGERIGAPRTVPPRPAPRADSLNAAERSFYSPERSSVRVCSRSGRIEHLTVWHVWSSGVARVTSVRAHTQSGHGSLAPIGAVLRRENRVVAANVAAPLCC